MSKGRPGIRDRISDGVGNVLYLFVTPIGPLGCALGTAVWAFAIGCPLPEVLLAGAAGAVVALVTGFVAQLTTLGISEGSDTFMDSPGGVAVGVALLVGPTWLSVATVLAFCGQLTSVAGGLLLGVAAVGGLLAIGGLVLARGEPAAPVSEADEEAAHRADWSRVRAEEAAGDPELAAALRAQGWCPDGPYEEMHAAYLRAWDEVKSARRASGRPVFRPTPGWSDPEAGDPPAAP